MGQKIELIGKVGGPLMHYRPANSSFSSIVHLTGTFANIENEIREIWRLKEGHCIRVTIEKGVKKS